MKKLSLLFFVVILGFGACGDSKDLGESQTINANDSQSKSNESSADLDLGESAQKSTLDSQDLRESKKIKG